MIRVHTGFVLGAGASMHLGYPSGYTLKSKVLDQLRDRSSHQRLALEGLGFDEDLITGFVTDLDNSSRASVDAFLEFREVFMDVGKAAIAACLIPYELAGNLFHPAKPAEDWYQRLASHLTDGTSQEFEQNQVSFITFNYDRSLESYLHTDLRSSYGLTEEAATELLGTLSFVHVHGLLGRLPWEDSTAPARPYEDLVNVDTVRAATEGIRVLHEGDDEDPLSRKRTTC